MEIKIVEASLRDKPKIQNMLQLYIHDFSEFDGHELNENGLYNYDYLDYYWTEQDRHPFIISLNSKLAGFVLLNRYSIMIENALTIAEFFILRKYRRQGLGKKTAFIIFDKFPSKWEIRQTKNNLVGQAFWKNVISEYSRGDFQEYEKADGWDGPIQVFQNKK